MTLSHEERQALTEFQERVRACFPGVGMRCTLFGSRARGDADPDSDVDLFLELDVESLDFADKQKIRRIAGEVSLAHNLLLSVLIADRSVAREREGFSIFTAIHEEGIVL